MMLIRRPAAAPGALQGPTGCAAQKCSWAAPWGSCRLVAAGAVRPGFPPLDDWPPVSTRSGSTACWCARAVEPAHDGPRERYVRLQDVE